MDIGSDEFDLPAIGDRVWEDRNGNGIQDPGEPGIVSALVYLRDGTGALLDVTFTDASGRYQFSQLIIGAVYSVQFIPPTGFVFSPADQGADDELDSDADPVTGRSPSIMPSVQDDLTRWDAGVVPSQPCVPPDEPLWIYNVTLSVDGNDFPILHFMDPNRLEQVTGYNVYRTADPAEPPASWLLVASDVIDMDEATPNKQWVDTSGEEPGPGSMWAYDVAAYNNRCPAEGPR